MPQPTTNHDSSCENAGSPLIRYRGVVYVYVCPPLPTGSQGLSCDLTGAILLAIQAERSWARRSCDLTGSSL